MKLFLAGCTTRRGNTWPEQFICSSDSQLEGNTVSAFERNSSVQHQKVWEILEKSKKNYQKKLELSLKNEWLEIITTVFHYARQNHSEEKSYLYSMVMLDRTSPRELKKSPKTSKWSIRKSFFFTKEWLITGVKCAERFWNLRHQQILRTRRTKTSQEQFGFSWPCFATQGTLQTTPWAPLRPLL